MNISDESLNLHPINRLLMKRISERRIVVILFVLVFITFSFAHEESKKVEQIYSGNKAEPAVELTASQSPQPADFKLDFSKNLAAEGIKPQ